MVREPLDGANTRADYLIGQYALDAGDLQRARSSLGRVLAADPDDLELRRQVFFLNVAVGRQRESLDQAQTLIGFDPSADEPRLALFIQALTDRDLAKAGTELDALAGQSVGGLIAPVLRAWLMVAKGDPAEALAALPTTGPDDPLNAVIIYHRAALEALAGRPEEGLADLMPLLDGQRAVSARASLLATRLIFDTKGPAAAKAFVADALAAQEQPVILGSVAEELDAGKTPSFGLGSAGEGVADILLAVSDALRQQVSIDRAIVYARLAEWAAPDDGEVKLTLAGLLLAQDNSKLADAIIGSLPSDSPWWWQAQLARAEALIAAGKSDDARNLLTQLSQERPKRIDALVKLGDLARQEEDYPAAQVAYAEAIDRVGEPARRHWTLFYARGVARERQADFDGAVADLQEALELEPDQPLVLNYLGYSWVERGEHLQTALGMLQKAVELRPRDGFIIDSLGWAYFKTGKLADAVTWLDRAVEAEPGDPVINDHLGDALWKAGRTREARFQWQRALTLSPDAAVAKVLEDKLAHGLPS